MVEVQNPENETLQSILKNTEDKELLIPASED